jgi:hypothetical protein
MPLWQHPWCFKGGCWHANIRHSDSNPSCRSTNGDAF